MSARKSIRLIRAGLLVFSLLAINYSCATGKYLKTSRVSDSNVTGVYTVIYFGNTYLNDPETVAVFDLEGDGLTFVPFANEFKYVIKKGLTAEEALKEARVFVSRHSQNLGSYIRQIEDGQGQTIGYELRPLYHVRAFGTSDILVVDYKMKEDKVVVSVDIKHHIRKRFLDRDAFH